MCSGKEKGFNRGQRIKEGRQPYTISKMTSWKYMRYLTLSRFSLFFIIIIMLFLSIVFHFFYSFFINIDTARKTPFSIIDRFRNTTIVKIAMRLHSLILLCWTYRIVRLTSLDLNLERTRFPVNDDLLPYRVCVLSVPASSVALMGLARWQVRYQQQASRDHESLVV